jgi:L-2-hydroxyglutarate oxidase LhgO
MKNRSGFTIFEVMITLFIMVSAVTIFSSVNLNALLRVLQNREYVSRIFLIKEELFKFFMKLPEKMDKPVIRVIEEEPNVRSDVLCAVFSPTYTSTAPYLFAIALAENAIQNGVDIFLDTEVVDINIHEKAFSTVHTTKGTFHARFVINAAGVFADKIAKMAGAQEYTIYGKKGATVLFDKEVKDYVKHSISHVELPKKAHYKGGGVLKTVEGIIQWGPTIKAIMIRRKLRLHRRISMSFSDGLALLFLRFPMM